MQMMNTAPARNPHRAAGVPPAAPAPLPPGPPPREGGGVEKGPCGTPGKRVQGFDGAVKPGKA